MEFKSVCPNCGVRVAKVAINTPAYSGVTVECTCLNRCEWTACDGIIASFSARVIPPNWSLLGQRFDLIVDDGTGGDIIYGASVANGGGTSNPPFGMPTNFTPASWGPVVGGSGYAHVSLTPEIPKSPIPKELVAEPITAFRIWNVNVKTQANIGKEEVERWLTLEQDPEGFAEHVRDLLRPSLGGVGAKAGWDSPVHHAACEAGRGNLYTSSSKHDKDIDVPAEECTCGIWALKDETKMQEALISYYKGQPMAYGTVQLWGRIFEHNLGFRAKHARPLSLSVFGVDELVARELGERYRCEASIVESPKIKDAWQIVNLGGAGGGGGVMSSWFTYPGYSSVFSGTASISFTSSLAVEDGEFCACGSTKPMKKHKHHYTCTECKGRTCRKCMTAVGEHKAKWTLHAAQCHE